MIAAALLAAALATGRQAENGPAPSQAAIIETMHQQSRARLAQQGLLESALRIRAQGGPLPEQARKIEALSGFAPGSAIVFTSGRLMVRPAPGSDPAYAQLQKLFDVINVVAPEHSVVALIGSGRP